MFRSGTMTEELTAFERTLTKQQLEARRAFLAESPCARKNREHGGTPFVTEQPGGSFYVWPDGYKELIAG